jgi:hypothetical protein
MSTISPSAARFLPLPLLLSVFLFFFVWTQYSTSYSAPPPDSEQLRRNNEKKYDKASGRNGKHANPEARKSAAERIEKVQKEIDRLVQKPNKSKEEAKQLEKLRDQLKHLRKKKDWSGETHSRTGKGN